MQDVEERGAQHAYDGTSKEQGEHHLFAPRKVCDFHVLKQPSNVVPKEVNAHYKGYKEQESDKMCPDVPGFVVKTEHALEAASERRHRWTVTSTDVFVISTPLRKRSEGNDLPCQTCEFWVLIIIGWFGVCFL